MAKITEADVVNHYFPVIVQKCRNSYKGLEHEDRIAEGVLALIHAIRTYSTKYGGFEKYFIMQFEIIMGRKNKEAWAMKKAESHFSLDASSHYNESGPGLDFFKSFSDDATMVDVNYFIEGLPTAEKQVILLLLNGRELDEISNELRIPAKQIQSLITQLQKKATEYWTKDE